MAVNPAPLALEPQLAERLAAVRRVFVLTGAGVSAESGVPTYRGTGGMWKEWNPEDYATPEAFQRDPVRVWRWYIDRARAILEVQPNPAHLALAELERRLPPGAMMIATQNIDGLHQRAGSQTVVEIHGSMHHCRAAEIDSDEEFPLDPDQLDRGTLPPRDGRGRLLRPAVVWFGEMLPTAPIHRIEDFLAKTPDLVIVIGTTAGFPYILDWALRPQNAGALLLEVNLDPTPLTPRADASWQQPAGQVLPGLVEMIAKDIP